MLTNGGDDGGDIAEGDIAATASDVAACNFETALPGRPTRRDGDGGKSSRQSRDQHSTSYANLK